MTPQELVIKNWLTAVEAAIDALQDFKYYLRVWSTHPGLGHLDAGMFDTVMLDLRQAGLSGWLDSERVAALRRAVTGGER